MSTGNTITGADRPVGTPVTVRVSRVAAVRLSAGVALRWAAVGAAAGAGLGCVLVALSRVEHFVPADMLRAGGWVGLVALPVAAGAVIGGAVSALRWSSAKRGALVLDERLGLRDRLATALELSERRASAVEQLAIADAEAIAGRVSARNAVPIRLGRAWLVAVPLVLVGVGLWRWMPSVALWTPARPGRTVAVVQPEARQQAAEVVKDAARAVEEYADTSAAKQLEALKRVEEELAQPRADRDSVTSAARAVGEAGESMTKQAERTQAEQQRLLDAMAERSRSADGSPTPQAAEMERLASALRRQDAAGAAAAAREASERFDQMAPAERAAAEEQLRELAAAMEEWDRKNGARNDAAASSEKGSGADAARPVADESGKAVQPGSENAKNKSEGQPAGTSDVQKQQGVPPGAKVAGEKSASPTVEGASRESAESPVKNAQSKGEERTPKGETSPLDQNPPRDATGAPRDGERKPSESANDAEGAENSATDRPQDSPTPRGPEQPRSSEPSDAKDTPQPRATPDDKDKASGSESPAEGRKEQPSASAKKEQAPGERSREADESAHPQEPTKAADGAERGGKQASQQDSSKSSTPAQNADEAARPKQEDGKQPQSGSQPNSQPDSQPDGQRDSQPGSQPDSKTDSKPDSKTASKSDPQKNQSGSPSDSPSQQPTQGEDAKDQGRPAQGAQEKQARDGQQTSEREGAQPGTSRGEQPAADKGTRQDPKQDDPKRPEDAPRRQDGQPERGEQSAPARSADDNAADDGRSRESADRGQDGEKLKPRDVGDKTGSPAEQTEKAEGSAPRPGEDGRGEGSKPPALPPKEVLEQLAERLKNSEAAQRQARDMMQRGKGLEEQARKMLEQASPEQRQALEKLARELAQARPGDGAPPPGAGDGGRGPLGPSLPVRDRTVAPSDATQVPVDARHSARDGSQRVISDIMNNEPTPAGAPTSTAAMERAFQQAAAGAESGIENQSVPADRSDLVRRVFRRYQDRVKQADQSGSPK